MVSGEVDIQQRILFTFNFNSEKRYGDTDEKRDLLYKNNNIYVYFRRRSFGYHKGSDSQNP